MGVGAFKFVLADLPYNRKLGAPYPGHEITVPLKDIGICGVDRYFDPPIYRLSLMAFTSRLSRDVALTKDQFYALLSLLDA